MHVDEPDLQWVTDASSGALLPTASFDAFFASEYRKVVGLAAALCGRRVLAEELAQEAFVAAFRRWPRVSRYDDPAAWVRRVVVNLVTSSLRRRAREVRALARISMRREREPEILAGDDAEFWRAVRRLPARQAQCVALRYLEDRPVSQIAGVLGIAEATVRVHLHQARSRLALQLGEQAEEREER